MSHALLEALAHARPVVASEVAAAGLERAREVCRVVPAGDARALAAALAELLGEREARERIARAGRELVLREHSCDAAAERLEQILREALAGR